MALSAPICAGNAAAVAVRRSACLAAVSITVPNAWPVLEVLALLPLLPAELQWVRYIPSMLAYIAPSLLPPAHDSAES